VDDVNAKKISVASYLREGTPHAVDGSALVVAFPRECKFHKESLEVNAENKALIEESVRNVLKTAYRVRFLVLDNGRDESAEEPREGRNGMRRENGPWPAQGRPAKTIDPAIGYAIDIFNGEMVSREKLSPKDKT
jgi:hypothetical protein